MRRQVGCLWVRAVLTSVGSPLLRLSLEVGDWTQLATLPEVDSKRDHRGEAWAMRMRRMLVDGRYSERSC